MSEQALLERSARQLWARPGGSHDQVLHLLRRALPVGIGALGLFLVLAPVLSPNGDVSFMLAKDNVSMAKERLQVRAATYRGEDSSGRPFEIRAGSAVQRSSQEPVVRMRDLMGKLQMAEGPATLAAKAGRYDMEKDIVRVDGPLVFQTADGYRVEATDVALGLKSRKLASAGPVSGKLPLGTFNANRIEADLSSRSVTLAGRARLHIVQQQAR
ncbi:MAG: LPS export ABC transporter periplasmic protein LptC [Alphaproteobacteria bacterium]|nr:LPS export ABC transporter periplasmic protein LptC [Alphaproteobacteria bacterium]